MQALRLTMECVCKEVMSVPKYYSTLARCITSVLNNIVSAYSRLLDRVAPALGRSGYDQIRLLREDVARIADAAEVTMRRTIAAAHPSMADAETTTDSLGGFIFEASAKEGSGDGASKARSTPRARATKARKPSVPRMTSRCITKPQAPEADPTPLQAPKRVRVSSTMDLAGEVADSPAHPTLADKAVQQQ